VCVYWISPVREQAIQLCGDNCDHTLRLLWTMNQSYNSYKGFGSPSTVYRPLLSPAHSSQNHRLAPRSYWDRFPLFPHSCNTLHKVSPPLMREILWFLWPQASYISQQEVVTHALPMEVFVTVIKILIGKDCPWFLDRSFLKVLI